MSKKLIFSRIKNKETECAELSSDWGGKKKVKHANFQAQPDKTLTIRAFSSRPWGAIVTVRLIASHESFIPSRRNRRLSIVLAWQKDAGREMAGVPLRIARYKWRAREQAKVQPIAHTLPSTKTQFWNADQKGVEAWRDPITFVRQLFTRAFKNVYKHQSVGEKRERKQSTFMATWDAPRCHYDFL